MVEMRSKVYCVQEPMQMRHGRPVMRFDLRPAQKFGDLVFLLDWSETNDLRGKEGELLWKLRERMVEFGLDDYILFSGDPTAMALAVCLALELNEGRVKCLQWDRVRREYRVINIDLAAQPADIEGS